MHNSIDRYEAAMIRNIERASISRNVLDPLMINAPVNLPHEREPCAPGMNVIGIETPKIIRPLEHAVSRSRFGFYEIGQSLAGAARGAPAELTPCAVSGDCPVILQLCDRVAGLGSTR